MGGGHIVWVKSLSVYMSVSLSLSLCVWADTPICVGERDQLRGQRTYCVGG